MSSCHYSYNQMDTDMEKTVSRHARVDVADVLRVHVGRSAEEYCAVLKSDR